MLREIFTNVPIAKKFTPPELQKTLTQEFVALINSNTSIDLTKNSSSFTSIEMEKIISVVKAAYQKIFESVVVNPDAKIFIANSLLCRLFELWKNSTTPELFFIKIRQAFTPAQIVAALQFYMNVPANQNWVLNFFYEHKNIFPRKQNKIRTIGIYFKRIYGGGLQRFLSMIIPVYIQMGYRVVIFNNEYKPELEYPLPPPSHNFFRIILKSHGQLLNLLEEMESYFKEYNVDLFISQRVWEVVPPEFQILFPKLCGLKMIMQIHEDIIRHAFSFPNVKNIYKNADIIVTLSQNFKSYWENFGMHSYYIPNPLYIGDAQNFHGRDSKKISNTILYVGRISVAYDKNTFATVQILNEVRKEIPDVKLKILGETFDVNALPKIKNFIAKNHLEDNVEFCGYHTDVGKFYEKADVMLNTSLAEGWSLVIAESKFYELPLVLYELPNSELLRDGKGYVAVPQGDYKAAARAIVKILTDTEFRCKLSAEARESIQPFIDYDIAGAWQKIFDDLDNDVPVPPHNVENEKIQTMLVKEIWQEKIKVQQLTAQVQYLAAQLQKKSKP